MINHKANFIFIHIPKTGGTSIEQALLRDNPLKWQWWKAKHEYMYPDVLNKVAKCNGIESYFSFSFVRNPWDKIVSQYHYNRDWFGMGDYTFDEYIRAFNKGRKISANNPYLLPWITDNKGNVLVDFIGRFENLQEDFDTVCDKIGTKRQRLPYKNKTKHKHYTEYYNDETRAIVAEKYAKDIEYFGYEFGE